MEIDGSIPIITGGNRGIGEGFVRAFLAAGAAKIYVGTRTPGGADHLCDLDREKIIPITLDVTRDDQVAAAARTCADVNIVINNAGAFNNERLIGADSMDFAREEMAVNYFGVLAMCRAFAPVLKKNGGGAIANVLSSAGIVALPIMGGYSPSKFAARSLGVIVRAELAEQKTTVTNLIVGSVETRMSAHVKGGKESPLDVANTGLKAIRKGLPEIDTDAMAIEVRANLQRSPETLERQLAGQLNWTELSTGR